MNHYFLIINVGSTSIKSRLFTADLQAAAVLAADYGTENGMSISGRDLQHASLTKTAPNCRDTASALTAVLSLWQQWITEANVTISAIGHRVVHGASWFDKVTPITPDVLKQLEQLDSYAPLHNPFNRLGIAMAGDYFPASRQFAVFDTAFHRHIPDFAGRYAIPEQLSAHVDFYRYGFHGISCQHSLLAAADILGKPPNQLNLIVLHLGGGASATAISKGISVDTSMGFSPTEGLMMASRCGDLDPMITLTLQREGKTPEQLDHLLNHQSGLRGVGGDSDMRRILQRAEQQDSAAQLALTMFCYRIKKYIGAYCAILGEISALIFTGGIGEYAVAVREKILTGLEPLGFTLDLQKNQCCVGQNGIVSALSSRFPILVIQAEEERVCAQQILTYLDE